MVDTLEAKTQIPEWIASELTRNGSGQNGQSLLVELLKEANGLSNSNGIEEKEEEFILELVEEAWISISPMIKVDDLREVVEQDDLKITEVEQDSEELVNAGYSKFMKEIPLQRNQFFNHTDQVRQDPVNSGRVYDESGQVVGDEGGDYQVAEQVDNSNPEHNGSVLDNSPDQAELTEEVDNGEGSEEVDQNHNCVPGEYEGHGEPGTVVECKLDGLALQANQGRSANF